MDIGDVSAGLEHLKVAFQSGAEAFKLWRSVKDSKATPEQADQIDRLFQDAETERQLAMASLGQAFGYQLCKCTLPPQVCTMTGFSESGQEQSRCPKCGREYPAPVTARAQTAISDFDPFEC